MHVKFNRNTDTNEFDVKLFIELINRNETLRAIDKTVELERIYPSGSAHLVVFQTKNSEEKIAKLLDEYFFNLEGIFQVYS